MAIILPAPLPLSHSQIFPPLEADELHIWAVSITKCVAASTALESLLSQEELLRQSEFKFSHLRQRYLVTRGMLRQLLAHYTNIPSADIVFSTNAFGKLSCANSSRNHKQIKFNLSHSRDLILYAFSADREVGIDIEFIKPNFSYVKIAERFFAPEEIQDLLALPAEQQLRAFFNCWVRKEALLKAWGIGLSHSLDKFSVAIGERIDQEPIHFQSSEDNGEFVASKWQLYAIAVDPAYASAVAIAAGFPSKVTILKFLH